jgi:hypothetical protein
VNYIHLFILFIIPSIERPSLQLIISKFLFNLFNSFDHITDLLDDFATFLCSLLVIEVNIGIFNLKPFGN